MNQIIRSPQGAPAFGERNGDWIWNGVTWVCSPCNDMGPPGPPCPPPGWPPPGCPPWFSGANSPPWYPGANAGVSFGTSPPPNPVRGHFWWDGATMWLFDGASWSGIGGPGTGANAAVGSQPPANPTVGTLWFDGNAVLVWDGARWVASSGGTATGTQPPTNPTPGQQWWNGATLYIWDGNAWVPTSQTKSYVQSTAPPSPNPGDTWWDGSQMRIWDGHAWETVGPGATLGPVPTTTLALSVVQPTAVALGDTSTWHIVPFTSAPQVDIYSGWDPVSKKYTPTKPGYYHWQGQVWGGGTGTVGVAILKNDPGFFNDVQNENVVATDIMGGANIGLWMTLTGICRMNGTTDYVRLFAINTAAGTFLGAGSNPCWGGWALP